MIENILSRQNLTFLALLVLGAVLNAFFTISLYANLTLHLGAVASVLALYLLGEKMALILCILIGIPLAYSMGNYFIPLLVFLEISFIVILNRFRWSVVYADILYWLLIGMPLTYVIFTASVPESSDFTFTTVTKQAINGLLYVSIASVILPFLPASFVFQNDTLEYPKLRQIIQRKLETVIIGISILVGLVAAENSVRVHESTINESLEWQSKEVALYAQNELELHQNTIAELSDFFSELGLSVEQKLSILQLSQKNNDSFISMLVTNADGNVIFAAPESFHQKLVSWSESKPMSVADRDYFINAMKSEAIYLSDVFLGRGFGTDIIVAISAPYYDTQHKDKNANSGISSEKPIGIVEGSLNLKKLSRLESQVALSKDASVVLIDSRRQVLYASKGLGIKLLEPFEISLPDDIYRTKIPVGNFKVSDQEGKSRDSLMFYRDSQLNNGWTAYVLQAPSVLIKEFEQYYVLILSIAIGLSLISYFLSKHIGRVIAKPLEFITAYFKKDSKVEVLDEVSFGVNALEYHELVESLNEKQALQNQFEETLVAKVEQKTSELRKTNQALTKARYEAEDASKLKSEFLANMSHEIRTPMNGVIGILDLLSRTKVNQEQAHRIELARSSANSLLLLINDILDLSKIESGRLEVESDNFDLKTLLENIVTVYQLEAEKNKNQLSLNLDGLATERVKGDSLRIRQVLTNLLSNAIKFTKEGNILLTASTTKTPDDKLVLTCSVKDSGVGIPEDKHALLFDAFRQADASTTRQFGGTGLGLTISKQLCRLMGGDLAVASEVGKGSEFTLTVVLEGADQSSVESSEECNLDKLDLLIKAFRKHEGVILVVEDNHVNQEVIIGLLDEFGLNYHVSVNGQEALNDIKNFGNLKKFSAVLMDCQMPIMDGYQATRKIRQGVCGELYQSIPIIAMTANAMSGDKEKCLAAGMSDYLSKPVDSTMLVEKLAHWLGISLDGQGQSIKPSKPKEKLDNQSKNILSISDTKTNDTEPNHTESKNNGSTEFTTHVDSVRWNKAAVLKRMLGKEKILRASVSAFLQDIDERATGLKQAYHSNDWDELQSVSHTLKGAAANIGAEWLSQRAAAIEVVLKQREIENDDLAEHLESQVVQVLSEIEHLKIHLKEQLN